MDPKKLRFVLFTTALFIFASVGMASANNGDARYIIPYREPPEIYVTEGDYIYIRAGWAACTYGLTQAFTNQANIVLESPTTSFVSSRKEARAYWAKPVPQAGDTSACVPNTDTYYRSWWDYPIGYLEIGEYDFHFAYWTDHSFPDGGDYDGDGKPDLLDVSIDTYFTIIVE